MELILGRLIYLVAAWKKSQKHRYLFPSIIWMGLQSFINPQGLDNGSSVPESLELKSLKECASQTLKNIKILKKEIENMKLEENQRVQLENHFDDVGEAVRNLFQKKIIDFQGKPYQFVGSTMPIADDNYKGIFKIVENEWLKSAANWEGTTDILKSEDHQKANLLFNQWCDLRMKFFMDLQKHEVIPKENLSEFINKDNGEEFLKFYISHRISPHHDVKSTYLNFDLKLSLEEGFTLLKADYIRKFFDKIVENYTWQKVEFYFLCLLIENQNQEYPSNSVQNPRLVKIKKLFLELNPEIGPCRKSFKPRIKDLFEALVNYLSSDFIFIDIYWHKVSNGKLMEIKLLHGILGYFFRYLSEVLPPHFMEEFKRSDKFHIVRYFEETIGLISTIYHILHARSKDLFNFITPESIPNNLENFWIFSTKLTDSNKHRKLSIFHTSEEEQESTDLVDHPTNQETRWIFIRLNNIFQYDFCDGANSKAAVRNSMINLGRYSFFLQRTKDEILQMNKSLQLMEKPIFLLGKHALKEVLDRLAVFDDQISEGLPFKKFTQMKSNE
ncbi:hypothetical protein PGT21_015122 [Puccinia graminis f. sp. tritici]|uniref:Uncharacterized protein n=1 Tax=Puccinia graminis f. sp. tritici TaxID=56615 RepID=A0A5B0M087_PUCGR|nr:hypothetical protein PGT21_015122 [Puccinia graminis f. sp. tritici]